MNPGPTQRFLTHPATIVAACVGLGAWVAWTRNPFAFLMTGAFLAIVVSRSLINLAFLARETVREEVWLPVHGEWYSFRDTRISVIEDDEGWRWVPVEDARKILALKVADGTLRKLYPDRSGLVEEGRVLHLRSDALVEYLARSTDDTALRFRTWIDRTISEPARRQRLGHRD